VGGTTSRAVLDEVGRVADRHARLQVEEEGDASELVQMVHRLRPERRPPFHQRVERDEVLAVVGLDVEEREVLGGGALLVLDLEDDLVLIVRLLDQVLVVLRIGIAEQREDARLRYAEDLGLLAKDVDFQIRGVAEPVGGEAGETWIGP